MLQLRSKGKSFVLNKVLCQVVQLNWENNNIFLATKTWRTPIQTQGKHEINWGLADCLNSFYWVLLYVTQTSPWIWDMVFCLVRKLCVVNIAELALCAKFLPNLLQLFSTAFSTNKKSKPQSRAIYSFSEHNQSTAVPLEEA